MGLRDTEEALNCNLPSICEFRAVTCQNLGKVEMADMVSQKYGLDADH